MHVCIMHYVFFVDVEVESGCPSPLPPVFGKTSSRGGQASGRGLERGRCCGEQAPPSANLRRVISPYIARESDQLTLSQGTILLWDA